MGPRFAGGNVVVRSRDERELTVVTFNVRYSEDVAGAIDELVAAGLLEADVVALQEMDREATCAIANALGMSWVYYPASVHRGRDFGNAILSRWPFIDDHKVVLPGRAPFDGRARIAVAARLDGPCGPFFIVSVHNETLLAGEIAQRAQVAAVWGDALAPYRNLPGVVAGDFNIVSEQLLAWMVERFALQGMQHVAPPPRSTTARSMLGEHALDHIFARGFVASGAGVAPSRGASDHHAVWASLRARCTLRGGESR